MFFKYSSNVCASLIPKYFLRHDRHDYCNPSARKVHSELLHTTACFGDAMSFDTTFQTNKFEMPFAPLIGTNHRKQTILFGTALLYDETIESFIWLFNTFLTAMSGNYVT